jgi:hypothetical protein
VRVGERRNLLLYSQAWTFWLPSVLLIRPIDFVSFSFPHLPDTSFLYCFKYPPSAPSSSLAL